MRTLVPVTVVTGAEDGFFARAAPALASTAFVLNGAATAEDAAQASLGCSCCRVRGGLTVTLLELLRKRSRGETPDFDRVLVAGGAGEGAQVLQELAGSPALAVAFRIDALAASERNDDAALADHVIGKATAVEEGRWLLARTLPSALASPSAIRALDDFAIESFTLGWDEPQALAAVGDWLHELVDARGERLLRVHGHVVTENGDAHALQALRHAVAPPAAIGKAESSRVRFVTRGLEPGDLLPAWSAGAAR